ncbi:MAG: MFS transporter [Chloroflexi bacterium]|nr:MFS transporter [Chloroflexota bacterium]
MTATSQVADFKRSNSLLNVFKGHDFGLLWIGQGASLLGDQFYLIALPWLVLQLTGDPLALGLVLALAGLPRAVFMLVGGVVTDRWSPRTVMLVSDVIRLVLATVMAVLVFAGSMQLWMLYVLALLFGSVAGFFLPASNSIVPKLVSPESLQGANAAFQGTAQLSVFLGPMLAGTLIASFASPSPGGAADLMGIGIALAIDALSFVVSIVTLWMMSYRGAPAKQSAGILSALHAGIDYAWSDPAVRILMTTMVAINLFFVGPMMVGVPVLADTKLAEGAAAFGVILSAHGGGNLVGFLLAGSLPKPRRIGGLALGMVALFGLSFLLFAFVVWTPVVAAAFLLLGICNGYISILFITWLQGKTPKEMLGRMMSLFLFSSISLVPVSMAISGALIKLSLEGLFVGAGVLLIATALLVALQPAAREMEI